jgi:SAM-dependent methyltransferase
VAVVEPGAQGAGSAWDRVALSYQNSARLSTDVVSYGPGFGTEDDYRLLGPLQGKRFLDLGCGGAQSAIAAAKQGAIAIGVDISVEQLGYAKRLIEQEEVKVELKHGDLAELAFQRADSVDIVFSAHAMQYVPDLNRVLRQVHRVLKPSGTLVFSLPHPVSVVTGRKDPLNRADQLSIEPDSQAVVRSYFDNSSIEDGSGLVEYHRTTSEIFIGLIRSGYRIDSIHEPDLGDGSRLPQALIIRARKES